MAPRRNKQPAPGQEALFVGGDITAAYGSRPISSWQEVAANPLLKSPYIVDDVKVLKLDVQTRAGLLLEAATKQGYANQRELGLQNAVQIEPHSTEIWGRYKRKTDTVVEGASKNAKQYEKEARQAFWKATGLEAMVATGDVSRDKAKALGRVWYRSFNKKFSGDEKPRQKAGLKKQITAQKKLKKQQAADQSRRAA